MKPAPGQKNVKRSYRVALVLYPLLTLFLPGIPLRRVGLAMINCVRFGAPKAVLETVQTERCTGLHGVPTMFIAILDHPDFLRYDLSTLRTGIMAGSPCPAEVQTTPSPKRLVSAKPSNATPDAKVQKSYTWTTAPKM